MSISLEVLQAEVLGLPMAERSRLLDKLVASLSEDAEAEAAWDAVANQREAELASGKTLASPLQDTMARLQARFPA